MIYKKYLFSTVLKTLPYYHTLVNYSAQSIMYFWYECRFVSFVLLAFHTLINFNQKNNLNKFKIKRKWVSLVTLLILEYWFSHLIVGSLAILLSSVCLLFVVVLISNHRNQRDSDKADNIFEQEPIQTIFMIQISRLLFLLLNKVLCYIPEDIRETYLEN